MVKSIARKLGMNTLLLFAFVIFAVYCNNHVHVVSAQPAIPQTAPAWSAHDAKRFPNCHDIRIDHSVSNEVVVVNNAGRHYREQTDAVWAINSDLSRTNDLFVIGVCH